MTAAAPALVDYRCPTCGNHCKTLDTADVQCRRTLACRNRRGGSTPMTPQKVAA